MFFFILLPNFMEKFNTLTLHFSMRKFCEKSFLFHMNIFFAGSWEKNIAPSPSLKVT